MGHESPGKGTGTQTDRETGKWTEKERRENEKVETISKIFVTPRRVFFWHDLGPEKSIISHPPPSLPPSRLFYIFLLCKNRYSSFINVIKAQVSGEENLKCIRITFSNIFSSHTRCCRSCLSFSPSSFFSFLPVLTYLDLFCCQALLGLASSGLYLFLIPLVIQEYFWPYRHCSSASLSIVAC